MKLKNIISAKDFDKDFLDTIFSKTNDIKKNPEKYYNCLSNKTAALLFFEPSTRTYESFYRAAKNLGMDVVGFRQSYGTSLEKGESLYDTVKMYEGYGVDLIVLRHYSAGAAKYISEITNIPVINGGDNGREHPTQALLDAFTIYEKFGRLNNLKIGFMGDLKYGRTVPSLVYLLSNFDDEFYFIAPDLVQIRKEIEFYIEDKNIYYEKITDMNKVKDVVRELDVLYVTRIQKERIPDPMEYEKIRGSYRVDLNLISNVKEDFIILHPLPRVDEISPEVDKTKYAYYFEQAKNGLFVRMALIYYILKNE